MRWLLLILIFEVTPSGDVQPRLTEMRVFRSEDDCNRFGRNYRDIIPIQEGLKSVSICIPEDAFDNPTTFVPERR